MNLLLSWLHAVMIGAVLWACGLLAVIATR